MDGKTIGIVENNSANKDGKFSTGSADNASRFIWMCDAYSIPLIYLTDIPGFAIGSEIECDGIIRHDTKMVLEATVSEFCIVMRKVYYIVFYAMSSPVFEPDAMLALPTASIAVMKP